MKKSYYFVLFASIAWCILIFITPLFAYFHSNLAIFSKYFFSIICHQMPERSFFILGEQLPVCARCVGIYTGWLFGVLLYAFRGAVTTKKMLAISAIPIALDALTQLTGLRESTNLLRLLTGLLFGIILALFLTHHLVELTSKFSKKYLK